MLHAVTFLLRWRSRSDVQDGVIRRNGDGHRFMESQHVIYVDDLKKETLTHLDNKSALPIWLRTLLFFSKLEKVTRCVEIYVE